MDSFMTAVCGGYQTVDSFRTVVCDGYQTVDSFRTALAVVIKLWTVLGRKCAVYQTVEVFGLSVRWLLNCGQF